ncbi:uncharacterized protein isoform X2 [Rhodnius prolixus]
MVESLAEFGLILCAPIERVERVFLRLQNLGTIVNQLSFFAACDQALLVEAKPASCLFTLMFYNVVAYCMAYIEELATKENWSLSVQMTEHCRLKHLAMSATKVVLEWTKAVTFIVTLVFMLLVFGLEQGLHHYRPTLPYTMLTWLYYMLTEKVFMGLILSAVSWVQWARLERLERLWVPVSMNAAAALISLCVGVLLLARGLVRAAITLLYLNVHLKLKQSYFDLYKPLQQELALVNRYREATAEELVAWDDVCAVCLLSMSRARVTPCHHIFHSDCLRNCLKSSDHCPLCKRHLIFY